MKIHIVIPVYNNYRLTNQILWSLYQREHDNIDSVTIMDDCSTDAEVSSGLAWWKEHGLLPLQVHRNEKNWGFLHTANAGLRIVTRLDTVSDEDIVILLSNDVLIHGGFIDQIKESITSKQLVGGVHYTHDTGWNKFGDKVFRYVEGWLLATTVAGWRELDYFDERYAPFDYEDVDLSTQAISMGYELVPLNNPGLVHLGGQSIGYNDKRLAQTNTNKKKFGEKWTR